MTIKKIKRYFSLLCIFIHGGGYKKANYLKNKGYFKSIGEHCYLQPYNFGTEPERISFGNNVHVASGVTFVTHDISSFMFNYMDKEHEYHERFGDISIGNNVFVGSNSTILYDVTIGDNVIIGAGSLVNKNIPGGTVAAGVPCKPIGLFDDYKKRLLKY
jgi:acetyltransferase-like isoleucine patch superfamily enzyme